MRRWLLAVAMAPLAVYGGAHAAGQADKVAQLRPAAECTVREDARALRELLQTLPGSEAEARASKRLALTFSACSSETVGLAITPHGQGLYNGRADLAAAAIPRAGAWLGGAAAASLTPWYVGRIVGKTPNKDYDGVSLGLQEVGTCVVKAAPDASARLVQAVSGSDAERGALTEIRAVLPGCVVQGEPISFKRDQLRLIVAEPLYHAIVDGPAAGRRS